MMRKHYYTVAVETDDPDNADEVMSERIYFDEDYGFDYRIDFEPQPKTDTYGRDWSELPWEELCDECGQPDNCGDCDHTKLSDEEVAQLKGGPIVWSVDRSDLDYFANRPVTDEEADRIAEAIGHSSIPEALQVVVDSIAGITDEDEEE